MNERDRDAGSTRSMDTVLLGVPLQQRWRRCPPELRALATGLETELSPLLHGAALPIPARKAQLTRIGGRCPDEGTPLTFDPWKPHEHRCPTCGHVHVGVAHDDWWAMGAMLWSAERTLQAAILGRMWQRDDLLSLASHGLEQFTVRWPAYPNQDNALGPTRPFFSTYLESVWLLNVSLAASVLQHRVESQRIVQQFISRVVEPARALICTFPEGASNRQTWHTAAQLACALLIGDTAALPPLMDGPLGVQSLIRDGLLDDGSWYEGENYHLFAHRGLWYGVTLLESAGMELPSALRVRFDTGFRTPLLGILPDGTFPSRRDSRYAVSVHQWRFAEWCELGLARTDDPVLSGWLTRLYASAHPDGDTGRARSTADIERDEPPCALSRADLGWRTLLCARETLPASERDVVDHGVVLPSQGLAVIRRDAGRIYVSLEAGHTGGGHGHPDRLGLTLQDGAARILEDPGTGSYVERTLHWYRSTLAHNAPLINRHSQRPVQARLLAYDAGEDAGWMRADASGLASEVRVVRTAAAFEQHVIDHLRWWSPRPITMDLPIHVDGEADDWANLEDEDGTAYARESVASLAKLAWMPANPDGAGGLEDGFDFLEHVECALLPARTWVALRCVSARAWYHTGADATIWRAMAPGPPRTPPRRFYWLRVQQSHGEIAAVWSLRDSVLGPRGSTDGTLLPIEVMLRDGRTVQHHAVDPGWRIDVRGANARASIELGGVRAVQRTTPREAVAAVESTATIVSIHANSPMPYSLGEANYRGAEESWADAGSPEADIALRFDDTHLQVDIDARTGPITAPAAGSENMFDNERADVNADGVQCYVGDDPPDGWRSAWLVVPDPLSGLARVSALVRGSAHLEAEWTRSEAGWRMHLRIPLASLPGAGREPFLFDVIVNERPAHRHRRRGQLVLSGSTGEFVYLRGDRHDPKRALRLRLVFPATPESLPAPLA